MALLMGAGPEWEGTGRGLLMGAGPDWDGSGSRAETVVESKEEFKKTVADKPETVDRRKMARRKHDVVHDVICERRKA